MAVDENDSEEDEVKPMEDDTVNQIRKNMEKMKMNRDLEHIQVTFNNYQLVSELFIFLLLYSYSYISFL